MKPLSAFSLAMSRSARIAAAAVHEHLAQYIRAQKACVKIAEGIIARAQAVQQMLGFGKLRPDRKGVRGLNAAAIALAIEISIIKRLFVAALDGLIVVPAQIDQCLRDAAHDVQRLDEIAGVDERLGQDHFDRRGPVAQAPAALFFVRHEAVLAVHDHVGQPFLHCGEGAAQNLAVAVTPVVLPGHDDNGAAPAARAAAAAHERRGMLDMAGFRVLTIENVLDPLVVQAARVQRHATFPDVMVAVVSVLVALMVLGALGAVVTVAEAVYALDAPDFLDLT